MKDKYKIFTKVRLADIFYVQKPNENFRYINKIGQKHIDFLLCDPINLTPEIGIELDDKSHNKNTVHERDLFVEKVFETAGMPLVRINAKYSYTGHEINEAL